MKKYPKILSFILAIVCITAFSGCDILDAVTTVSSDTNTSTQNNTNSSTDGGFTIHMIDIGQGDSILLECNDEYMLIDAGELGQGGIVNDYLKDHNVTQLDYALITHPHSDHYGGMLDVLKNESVTTKNIVMTEAMNTTRTWEKLVDYIDQKNYNVIFPKTNDTIHLGDTTLTMYVPEIVKDLNNCSIVVRAEYDGMSAILTGDAESSEEKLMLDEGFNVQANVLKAGHHGSRTSTSKKFLTAVNPQIALISCGKNNDYGHPHKETVKKFNDINLPMYRTDELGSIVVTFNNGNMSLHTTNGTSEEIAIAQNNTTTAESKTSSNTSSKTSTSTKKATKKTAKYVGNKNSKVLHTKDCATVSKMSDANKVYFISYEDAIAQGYTPAKDCNPQ